MADRKGECAGWRALQAYIVAPGTLLFPVHVHGVKRGAIMYKNHRNTDIAHAALRHEARCVQSA